jgi:hypothetical protein
MARQSKERRVEVDGYSFSEGELEWASKNIGYLQSFLRGNRLQLSMLAVTFVLGLLLYAISQLIDAGVLAGSPVLADFLYNLGITLWTSVVLVFLLEVLVERQRGFTERYLRLVQEALRRQDEAVPEGDGSDTPDDPVRQQVQLLIELRAEVAALRARLDAEN